MKPHSPGTLLAFGAALVALAGCGGPAEDRSVSQEESAAGAPPPSGPEVDEPVSIIRPDVTAQPVVDLPPEPLAVTIVFPEGTTLNDAAESQLSSILEREALAEGWPILLRGHSDSGGTDAANLRASRLRAEAVAAWLSEHGIARERIRIIPFGEQNPVAPNANPDGSPNEQGRARNRRVDVIVSPPGESKEDESGTAIEDAAGRDTAAETAIKGLSGVETP